jgi:TRAP transporter 4TM/12TM fusion protein
VSLSSGTVSVVPPARGAGPGETSPGAEGGSRAGTGGRFARLVLLAAAAWVLFHFLAAGFGLVSGFQLRAIHVGGALALVFAWRPLRGQGLWIVDRALMAAALLSSAYLVIFYDEIVGSSWFLRPELERMLGLALFGCVLEAIRRALGPFFLGLVGVFLAYALLGDYIPGMFGHGGLTVDRLVYSFYMGAQGVTGMLMGISATVVALFLIFGEILNASGGGETFINIAMRLGGRMRGGAGMVAVIASGFMGMINGSAVANVTSTGVLTIPLMRRLGFDRNLAGATEAVASTGGQFMPPIMGPGAFLMAELLGISYFVIVEAALIPSLLFFFGLLLNIWLLSRALGLQAIPRELIPSRAVTYAPFALASLLAPIGLLVAMVAMGYTVQMAAFWGIAAAAMLAAAGVLRRRRSEPAEGRAPAPATESASATPAGPRDAAATAQTALRRSADSIAYVGMIILAAQIVVGVINLTGVGVTLSELVVALGSGNAIPSLLLAMATCVVLGMGMPTPAAYAVAAAVLGAPLARLGFEALPAHLFLYYYACLAAITPPVAAAIFAAIAISGGGFARTAAWAVMLSASLYVIPFLFVLDPVLIGEGEAWRVAAATLSAAIGVAILCVATIGWCAGRVALALRLGLAAAAFAMLAPGLTSDVLGAAGAGAMLAIHLALRRSVA